MKLWSSFGRKGISFLLASMLAVGTVPTFGLEAKAFSLEEVNIENDGIVIEDSAEEASEEEILLEDMEEAEDEAQETENSEIEEEAAEEETEEKDNIGGDDEIIELEAGDDDIDVTGDGHVHQWSYTVSGATITATCKNSDRQHTGSITATLTIVAPARTVYDDSEASVEAGLSGLEEFNAVTEQSITTADIKYSGRAGTAYTESSIAPVKAGKYKARITVGGKTARVDYEIAKAIPDLVPPTAKEFLEYTGKKQELVNEGTATNGTIYYALGDNDTLPPPGTKFFDDVPEGKEIKTYYVWYMVLADNDNYSDIDPVCITVEIVGKVDSGLDGSVVNVDVSAKGTAAGRINISDYLVSGGKIKDIEIKGDLKDVLSVKELDGDCLVYSLEKTDSGKTGSATVNISSKNYFDYKIKISFTTKAAIDSDDLVVCGIEDKYYTGSSIKQENLAVYSDGKLLLAGQDYSVSYLNNVNAGTAKVIVKGKGNYKGTQSDTFEIKPADINTYDFVIEDFCLKYNGKDQKKTPTLLWNGKKVSKDNYSLTYYPEGTTFSNIDTEGFKPINSFKKSYMILLTTKENSKGVRNFMGESLIEVKIVEEGSGVPASALTVKLNKKSYSILTDANDFGAVEPVIESVKRGTESFTEGVDYTALCISNYYVGTGYLIIDGSLEGLSGKISGKKYVPYKITATSLSKASVSGVKEQIYDPAAASIKQTGYKLSINGTELVEGKDYTTSYLNNKKAGTATIVFKGTGRCSGTKKVSFKIGQYPLTASNVECDSETKYAKGGARVNVTVRVNGIELLQGTDYTVTYSDNKIVNDAHKAAVTIKGKGNFKAEVTRNFKISQAVVEDGDGKLVMTVKDMTYNGTANKKLSQMLKAPSVVDTVSGKALKKDTDFDRNIKYAISTDGESFTEILEADLNKKFSEVIGEKYGTNGVDIKATITLKGNYSGTYSTVYRVSKASISSVKAAVSDQKYSGHEIVFDPESTDFAKVFVIYTGKNSESGKLVYGTDYEIVPGTYSKNIKKGTASVMIRGKGMYSGTKKVSFKIVARNL